MPSPTLSVNEYGTPITVATCAECGGDFSVCPAIPPEDFEQRWGTGCLADTCPSYDLGRDIDIFFEPMAEAGLIQRREAQ
jgi:hypothetical protein